MKVWWYFGFFGMALIAQLGGNENARIVSWKEFNLAKERRSLLQNRSRLNLINYLIAQRNYQSYLEIGVEEGEMFRLVKAVHKTGVDPFPRTVCDFPMTSDDFFQINQKTFDLIFIDGLHLYEQVLRDITNSLHCLNPGGVIVMHDCLPEKIEHQVRRPVVEQWTGDVWKAASYIRMHCPDIHFCVLDMDHGCGIITPHSSQKTYPQIPIEQLDWDYYICNKNQLLNVMTLEDWLDKRSTPLD